ncbi:MAG: ATP-binding protein [Promethearchaeota archaeon]|nr:MAG: ATP-binding protein [Candidatus Lokiarchaeota archaeon]
MNEKGQIVSGRFSDIHIRQKSKEHLELGDLLVVGDPNNYTILQVFDLGYASQLSQQSRELMSGFKLEGFSQNLDFYEPELRNYIIAASKSLLQINKDKNQDKFITQKPKILPAFFDQVRLITEDDLKFLENPKDSIFMGNIRSGSKKLKVEINLDGDKVLNHHLLIPATTGRGKSNLMKVMLWDMLPKTKFGVLVLDPHDEYYGRHGLGLKDHPDAKENLVYYTTNPPKKSISEKEIVINIESLLPSHLLGIFEFTDAQKDAIYHYYNKHNKKWIEKLVKAEDPPDNINPGTIGVIQRKLSTYLGMEKPNVPGGDIKVFNKAFKFGNAGQSTIENILKELSEGKTVILDTSIFDDKHELLIGSMICRQIFNRYQKFKADGELKDKPVISVVIEEAPRVLSAEALISGNIYGTIAKEGRKFKIGLIAITQLTSVIPKTVLANMNTKIILGNELVSERNAIIDSASQDLSSDDRAIASLDTGEAIITSNFTKFAVPIAIPFFDTFAKKYIKENKKEKERPPVYEG